MEMYKVCYSNNYDLIEKVLMFNEKMIANNSHYIEIIYGCALFYSNVKIIDLINLYVREHAISINKYNVLSEIYTSNRNRIIDNSINSRRDEPNYTGLCDLRNVEHDYLFQYWNMFVT